MKNITSLIAMAMLSTMSMSVFNSCTNDETLELSIQDIEGTWMHDDRLDNDYDYMKFNADGTGSKWEVYKNAPDARPHDQEDFTFSLSNGKITFYEPDGERDIENLKVKSIDEIVIDRNTYIRQK